MPNTAALSERASLGNRQRATTPYAQRTLKHRPNIPNDNEDSMLSARKASLNALVGEPTTARMPAFSATVGHGSARPTTLEGQVDIDVGDVVEVPGGMTGTVKFLGNVKGKKGVFAGIELSSEYAPRGKNDGDVEGTRYFTTSIPGSGIFLPAQRAFKRSPRSTIDDFPSTPGTPAVSAFDPHKALRTSSQSPQTPQPQIPKFSQSARPGTRSIFSQSVGPGARAPSPQLKKSRPSLPRPESPLRKQPSLPAPAPAPAPSRGATPGAGFSQSVRGGRSTGMSPGSKTSLNGLQTPSAIRSPSRSQSRNADRSADADSTPTPFTRSVTNGASRPKQTSINRAHVGESADSEEIARLKRNLEDRDRQLKEQATSLAEMESSLADLQSLVTTSTRQPNSAGTRSSQNTDEIMTSDAPQLRAILREKNERIATLTAEFDAHRADFRSTIDTLEMASTETERVYEKRVDELLRENAELSQQDSDVENVALQLKQLEELVQELEDGLEDARRGEAEARGEVEFLRGEVERGHSELRREREKAAKALKGAAGTINDNAPSPSTPTSANNVPPRDLSQRDDEIRGLKAIIHSLSSGPDAGSLSPMSRHSNPNINGGGGMTNGRSSNSQTSTADQEQLAQLRASIDTMNREKSELRGQIERKIFREEELERELASLRKNGNDQTTPRATLNGTSGDRNHSDSAASAKTAIRPSTSGSSGAGAGGLANNRNGIGVQSRPETGYGSAPSPISATFEDASEAPPVTDDARTPRPQHYTSPPPTSMPNDMSYSRQPDVPEIGNSSGKVEGFMAQITGEGPAPGKSSKRVDMEKWCALCERDGHESVDCPFEEY